MWDQLIAALPDTWRQINPLDAVLGVICLLFVIGGIRRGLVGSVASLAALVVSVALAIKYYRPVAAIIQEQWELANLLANIAAFFVVFIPVQIILAMILAALASAVRPLRPWLGPLVALDHLLGAIPGLIQGVLVATVLLTPLYLVPLSPQLERVVQESVIAGQLTRAAAAAVPHLETLFGRAIDETMLFRSRVVTEPGEKLSFGPFPLPKLRVDPQAEADLLALLNAERQQQGLPPLILDARLREVARQHSAEMFRLAYFSHQSPVTGSPADRIRKAKVAYRMAGENLAYAPTTRVAHAGLMNSPPHRRNILAREYTRIGIGVVSAGIYGRMFTQDFVN